MFTLLFTLLAMCSTLVGSYVAVAARQRMHLLMGLGAGVLLGDLPVDLVIADPISAESNGGRFFEPMRPQLSRSQVHHGHPARNSRCGNRCAARARL
jgi:hypothetical protein